MKYTDYKYQKSTSGSNCLGGLQEFKLYIWKCIIERKLKNVKRHRRVELKRLFWMVLQDHYRIRILLYCQQPTLQNTWKINPVTSISFITNYHNFMEKQNYLFYLNENIILVPESLVKVL